MTNRQGILMIISAPSGTGKSTLIKMLRQDFPHLSYSVSYTTRSPRQGEEHGQDYFFVSKEEFINLRDKNLFAEWAAVHDNFYGTPLQRTIELREQGQDIIFDIDVQGADQLKQSLPMGCFVFLLPPSLEALHQRLNRRGTDSEQIIQKRLENAVQEIKQSKNFEFHIVNDDLDTAYRQLKAVYLAQTVKRVVLPGLEQKILNTWKDNG